MDKIKYLWRIWANALGVKAKQGDDIFSDDVAITRTILVLVVIFI